jgi:hypothetical protein
MFTLDLILCLFRIKSDTLLVFPWPARAAVQPGYVHTYNSSSSTKQVFLSTAKVTGHQGSKNLEAFVPKQAFFGW